MYVRLRIAFGPFSKLDGRDKSSERNETLRRQLCWVSRRNANILFVEMLLNLRCSLDRIIIEWVIGPSFPFELLYCFPYIECITGYDNKTIVLERPELPFLDQAFILTSLVVRGCAAPSTQIKFGRCQRLLHLSYDSLDHFEIISLNFLRFLGRIFSKLLQ